MFVEMKNVVGPGVRAARHAGGRRVTQRDLAAKIQTMGMELDRTAISKIENGKRSVNDIEIVAICKALGVSVVTLFGER